MNKNVSKGTALVTGASSGIGNVFARRLACQGYDLVVTARREGLLKALASELVEKDHVKVDVLPADLSTPEGIRRVEECIASLPELMLLVNNAGFGVLGAFAEVEIEKSAAVLWVHNLATVRLTRAALPGMIARKQGSIINVSSVAAFLPVGGNVMYSSTKAFLNVFTQTLAYELIGTGVKVQALCPGFTYTGFHDTPEFEGNDYRAGIPKFLWLKVGDVVDGSLRALKHGPVIYVPSFRYGLIVQVAKLGITHLLGSMIFRFVKEKAVNKQPG